MFFSNQQKTSEYNFLKVLDTCNYFSLVFRKNPEININRKILKHLVMPYPSILGLLEAGFSTVMILLYIQNTQVSS